MIAAAVAAIVATNAGAATVIPLTNGDSILDANDRIRFATVEWVRKSHPVTASRAEVSYADCIAGRGSLMLRGDYRAV